MRVDLGAVYNEKLTIVNVLDAKDAALKQDAYFKTELDGCMWYETTERAVESNGTVDIGTVHRVQIPESDMYRPYKDWKVVGNRIDHFTLRDGDYVFKGTVEEEITPTTIKAVVKAHEPDVFQIQHWRDLTKGDGFTHSTDGALRFSEVYYIEG